jgi:hypothetical protein
MVVGVAVCRDARNHALAFVDVDVTRSVDRSVECASTYGILMLWVRVTTRAGSHRIDDDDDGDGARHRATRRRVASKRAEKPSSGRDASGAARKRGGGR